MALNRCFICGIKKDNVKEVLFKGNCKIILKCDKIITHNHDLCKSCSINYKKNFCKKKVK